MRTKIFALVIFFLWVVLVSEMLSVAEVFAQYVDTAWVRRYNGPGNGEDNAYAIAVDDSGYVYVTGRSISGSNYDFATIKYKPNGDTAWVRRYNGLGSSNDYAWAIVVDDSGNAYVTGPSWDGGSWYDYATIKYFPNGDTDWVRIYDGPNHYFDDSYAIATDNSGNIYVTGHSDDNGTDYYGTIKYYPNGDTAWVRRHVQGAGGSYAYGIAVDDSGNVYVTGHTDGIASKDYAVIKYYSNGDTAWTRTYNGTGNGWDEAPDIAVDNSGNVYVTGRSMGIGSDPLGPFSRLHDCVTIKYRPNGDTAWLRRYNGPNNLADAGMALTVGASGEVYVTGFSAHLQDTDPPTIADFLTIKYDSLGNELWVRTYDGPANWNDGAWDVELDNLKGYIYITGHSTGSGTNQDYVTLKYDSSGNQIWLHRYNGPANGWDEARDIAIDDFGNVYITGKSWGSGTAEDYATIKYIQYDSIPFAPAVNYGAGRGPRSVFCADLDGDADLDLSVTNEDSDSISILENNGDGNFQSKVDYDAGHAPHSIFCADLDGDTDLDLVVANYSDISTVTILKNNGDGTFQSKVDYSVGSDPSSVFCADLDGDGDLDLAVANDGNNNVSILKNNGDGTFQTKVDYGAGDGPRSIFCADLDGDTDLDLAVAYHSSGIVSILNNNGDGTFQTAVNYGAGCCPSSVFCADLDGDTDLDLAVANEYSDSVSIFKNNGDGTFQTAVNYGAGDIPSSVFCADLDGDTDLDLAVANYWSNNVSILKNNGDGTFQTKVDYGAGSYPHSVFCADLDGDTDLDLAVANYSGNVSILKNLTQAPANQPPWAFSLISPSNQDTTFGSTTFQWQIPYDPNFGDQFRYDLYISSSPGFEPLYTTIDSNLAVSKFTTALDTGTYFWKVKAKDNWGAERWSTQTWSFDVLYLTDTLSLVAFSPVDLIVTDPVGDSIGIGFNTIPGATYDTMQDLDTNGDKDDLVTIPNRLVGEYLIRVIAEPQDTGNYTMGIRINGTDMEYLAQNQASPPPGQADTFTYNAPWYMRGDASGDWKINLSDVIFLANYILKGGASPDPLEAADVNCDGLYNLVDVICLANYVLKGHCDFFPCNP